MKMKRAIAAAIAAVMMATSCLVYELPAEAAAAVPYLSMVILGNSFETSGDITLEDGTHNYWITATNTSGGDVTIKLNSEPIVVVFCSDDDLVCSDCKVVSITNSNGVNTTITDGDMSRNALDQYYYSISNFEEAVTAIGTVPAGGTFKVEVQATYDAGKKVINATNFTYSTRNFMDMKLGESFTITYDGTDAPDTAAYRFRYYLRRKTDESGTSYYPVICKPTDGGYGLNGTEGEDITGLRVSAENTGERTIYTFTAVKATSEDRRSIILDIYVSQTGDFSDSKVLTYNGSYYIPTVPVSGISIDEPARTTYKVGESVTLIASANGYTTVTDPEFVWGGDDEKVVDVDENTGEVKFIGKGRATVIAAYKDDTTITDTITFDVEEVPVSSVTINKPAKTEYTVGEQVALTASVNENATVTAPEFEWSSDNENAATVDSTGKVTFVGSGKATITAAYKGDTTIKDTVTFTVNVPVSSVTIETPDKAEYMVGESVILSASVNEDATVSAPTILWSSSDTKVATVDGSGEVKFVGEGSVTITAAYADDTSVKGTIVLKAVPDTRDTYIETPIDYTKATEPTLVKTSDDSSLLYVMAVTKAQAEADSLVFISVKDKDTGKTARYYTKDVYKGFGFIGENGQKYVETGADGIYFVIVKFTGGGVAMSADRYTVDMELITPVG